VPVQYPIDINISIDIKDGKYRYKVETQVEFYDDSTASERANFIIDSSLKMTLGSGLLGNRIRLEMKENVRIGIVEKAKQVKEIIEGLEKSLKNHIKSSSDNW
jgi:hypothetical protein